MYSNPHFTYVVWWLHCLVVKLSIPGAQVGEHVGGDGQPEVGDAHTCISYFEIGNYLVTLSLLFQNQ